MLKRSQHLILGAAICVSPAILPAARWALWPHLYEEATHHLQKPTFNAFSLQWMLDALSSQSAF